MFFTDEYGNIYAIVTTTTTGTASYSVNYVTLPDIDNAVGEDAAKDITELERMFNL